jgi:Flp pilus assembly pilin Flp
VEESGIAALFPGTVAAIPVDMNTLKGFIKGEQGQTATEYMLIISVVIIAVVAAAYTFVPTFQQGVSDLSQDVSTILKGGCINGCAPGEGR